MDSPDLHRINALLRQLPHTNDFPTYQPHVTIAYLKPGQGAQYDGQSIPGVTGQTITLHSIAFSGKDGKQIEIPLAGEPAPDTIQNGSIPPSNLQPNAATSGEPGTTQVGGGEPESQTARKPDSQTDLSQRILDALQARPGGMGTPHLREQLGADKPAFDQAMLSLYRARKIHLDEHDWPAGLNEAQKEELVGDGKGRYYVAAGIREPEEPETPAETASDNAGGVAEKPQAAGRGGFSGDLFRGTESGTAGRELRESPVGELGRGSYATPHRWLAATYGGGPQANVKAGTREVHQISLKRPLEPEEVGYLDGGADGQSDAVLRNGAGTELWRGRITGKKADRPLIEEMNAAARKAGAKLIIGGKDSLALNQVAILDPSIANKPKRLTAEEALAKDQPIEPPASGSAETPSTDRVCRLSPMNCRERSHVITPVPSPSAWISPTTWIRPHTSQRSRSLRSRTGSMSISSNSTPGWKSRRSASTAKQSRRGSKSLRSPRSLALPPNPSHLRYRVTNGHKLNRPPPQLRPRAATYRLANQGRRAGLDRPRICRSSCGPWKGSIPNWSTPSSRR